MNFLLRENENYVVTRRIYKLSVILLKFDIISYKIQNYTVTRECNNANYQ